MIQLIARAWAPHPINQQNRDLMTAIKSEADRRHMPIADRHRWWERHITTGFGPDTFVTEELVALLATLQALP